MIYYPSGYCPECQHFDLHYGTPGEEIGHECTNCDHVYAVAIPFECGYCNEAILPELLESDAIRRCTFGREENPCDSVLHVICFEDVTGRCGACREGYALVCLRHLPGNRFVCQDCGEWHREACRHTGHRGLNDFVICERCQYWPERRRYYEGLQEQAQLAFDGEIARLRSSVTDESQLSHVEAIVRMLSESVTSDGALSTERLGLFRAACEQVHGQRIAARSPLEERFLRLLTERRLNSAFRINAPVPVEYPSASGGYYEGETTPDFAHIEKKIAIYCDSYYHHLTIGQFEKDHRVTNALQAAGWYVLRFTSGQINSRPDEVMTQVRTALSRPG